MLGSAPEQTQGDMERQEYESIPVRDDGLRHGGMKFLRYFLITAVVIAFSAVALDGTIERVVMGSQADFRALEVLVAMGETRPVTPDEGCPNDGSVCICTDDFMVQGQGVGMANNIVASVGKTACQRFKFKVGDMLFVEKPSGNDPKYRQANMVAKFTGSPVVHNAIVFSVPPDGVPQTADTVMIVEALKGSWKQVLKNKLSTLVTRYPFGGISVRRVDAIKYPQFFSPTTAANIKRFAQQVVGEPFDSNMVNPAKKSFSMWTHGRFFANNPACPERKRAREMYTAGGPHMWICSQLMAWMIAFPGGLDMGPTTDGWFGCKEPVWVIENLEPNPGDFLDASVAWTDPMIKYHAPCSPQGCFIGVPAGAAPAPQPQAVPTPSQPTPLAPQPQPVPTPSQPTPTPTDPTGPVDPACPSNMPHSSDQHLHKICYKTNKQAYNGYSACEDWCTLDVTVGDGCGDNSLKLCSNVLAPYVQAIPLSMPSPSPPVVQATSVVQATPVALPVAQAAVVPAPATAPMPVPAKWVCSDAGGDACASWHTDPAGDQCLTNKEVMESLCMVTCGFCPTA